MSPLTREDVATPLDHWSPPKPTVSKWCMEPSPTKKTRRRKFPKPFATLYGFAGQAGEGDNDDEALPTRPASASAAVGGSGVAAARAAKELVRSRGQGGGG